VGVTSSTVSGRPVEFDPYSEDFFCAPFDTYRRMRDEAPVYHSEKYDFWALTRYDDVAAAIKDHGTFSSAKGVTLDMVKAPDMENPVGKIIISLDPPEHERMRKLVNRVFTPRAIASLEQVVRDTIDRYVAQLDPSSFDAVADFARSFRSRSSRRCSVFPQPTGSRCGFGSTRAWNASRARLPPRPRAWTR
jgi:cytochrome P450